MPAMVKWMAAAKWVGLGVVAVCLAGAAAYRWGFAQMKMDVYTGRLAELSGEYEALRLMYNQAVRRTAVTELIVRDGRLSLAIRTIEGVHRVIDTPFDPASEIYCDYVLLDGRLWIRRVYDAKTPPSKGLVITDALEHVDWNDPAARYGKAVYRALSEGRWIVTVTGDGSLGLAKVDSTADVALSGPPPVRDYDEIEKQINDALTRVTAGDVLKHLVSRRR